MKEKFVNETMIELENLKKKQERLGKKCAQLDLTDSDLFMIAEIKKYKKEKEVKYLIDNRLSLDDLERKSSEKHFDPASFFTKV